MLRTDRRTDEHTNERTDRRTDGRSGPTTRPAFAKATQVTKSYFTAQISESFDKIQNLLIKLCQFNGNIIKVSLSGQKGAGVMYTNAHSQHIL